MDNGAGMTDIVAMLNTARRLINEGNPVMALQAVMTALRMTGGEEEVLPALRRAHEQYQNHARASAAANELSALFAECAIAEVSHKISAREQQRNGDEMLASTSDNMDLENSQAVPILAESGRMQVVLDASADGSSFVCHRCGGVVSNARRDEHMLLWCSQAPALPEPFRNLINSNNNIF